MRSLRTTARAGHPRRARAGHGRELARLGPLAATLLVATLLVATLVVATPGVAPAQAVRGSRITTTDGLSLPVGHGTILPGNDDGSTGLVDIGFELNFFGTTYSQLYVNNNGNVTFGSGLGTYTPFALTGPTDNPIIAAFFADVDTRALAPRDFGAAPRPPGVGYTSYGYHDASSAFGQLFAAPNAGGRDVFSVTWSDVGYYGSHTDLTNTFQLNLIRRDDIAPGLGNFDIEFNYDRIQWETGDASGGHGGFGGTPAAVGYSAGSGDPGTFTQLAGSFTSGALVDGGTSSLIGGTFGTQQPGRYVFQVRNGGAGVPGETQTNPLLPTLIHPGDPAHGIAPVYQFNDAASGRWFDPPDTWAYDYRGLGGTLFTRVGLPVGFAAFDLCFGAGFATCQGGFAGGSTVDFLALLGVADGIDAFRIAGIDPLVDSTDPLGFPTQLFFAQPTGNAFTMTPVLVPSAVPEPHSWALLGAGLLGVAAAGRRRRRAMPA